LQGTEKSSALRTLCPNDEWFSDDLPLGVDSKLVIERTGGKWIIEASEMHGHRGREAEQLKAFLSRQVDGPVRLAYAQLPTSVPRQFVIVGTTNTRTGYLKDHTGSRRFWPVRVERFDVATLACDRDKLWAEAVAREASGESIRLHPDLWAEAGAQQDDRRAMDPWEPILASLFDGDLVQKVAVSKVWDVLELETAHRDNRAADRVAAIAQRYGFTKQKGRIDGGKPVWYWERENSDER
jgi:predicted P-loop ATPase